MIYEELEKNSKEDVDDKIQKEYYQDAVINEGAPKTTKSEALQAMDTLQIFSPKIPNNFNRKSFYSLYFLPFNKSCEIVQNTATCVIEFPYKLFSRWCFTGDIMTENNVCDFHISFHSRDYNFSKTFLSFGVKINHFRFSSCVDALS